MTFGPAFTSMIRALSRACAIALTIVPAISSLEAADAVVTGQPSGRILAAGDRRVMVLSPEGEVLWEYPTQLTHDVWMLADGHVLFADGVSVTEVTADKRVVFQYRAAEQKGGGTYACQRLADGRTLIGENSTGRVLEVDREGKIVFSIPTVPSRVGEHHNMRMARKLPNGNYLVCHSGARLVKEYTPKGEVVWEVKPTGALAFAALRTPQGSTLVSSLDQIEEFDAAGKLIWACSIRELSGVTVRNLTGMHLLANGHVVAGCYQAYQDGAGCGLLEFSREKKPVWQYARPRGDGTQMAVQLLTSDGQALPGPCLR